MKFWNDNTPTSHLIAIVNVFIVLIATVVQMLLFGGDYWFHKLYPLFQFIEFINFPVYWAAEYIPRVLFGYGIPSDVLAMILFVGGAYLWARFVCFVLRVDSFEIRRKERPTEEI